MNKKVSVKSVNNLYSETELCAQSLSINFISIKRFFCLRHYENPGMIGTDSIIDDLINPILYKFYLNLIII